MFFTRWSGQRIGTVFIFYRKVRPGIQTDRSGCKTGGSSIYLGIEDHIAEDQQIPLQKCNALEEHLA
jgi:hypothetical protein